jgi:lipocalin-like protein
VVSEAINPDSDVARRFVGAWRYVGATIDGKPDAARGPNPKGLIVYDLSGHMAVHVAPEKPAKPAGGELTPADAKLALAGVVAYFGAYSIDEGAGTVTHHKHASVQPGDGGDVVRAYEFAGDRLILRPVESKNTAIIWERIT